MQKIKIPCVVNNGKGASTFSVREVALHGDSFRMLSEQQNCINFRLRQSESTYSSDWHVAGDSTLLVILKGIMRIELRNGDTKEFTAGAHFIAEDYLLPDVVFDNTIHGHRAEAVGTEDLSVLHLKLSKARFVAK